jgi:hypothetical protein
MKSHLDLPDAKGTPMPVKTPINFRARKAKLEDSNRAAMRKLIIVSFVSIFFIVA